LLSTRIAPGFASDRLTVLRHFPASQAALARTCPADSTLADRFEVFFGAMELANGFVELRDLEEQRQRMLADLDKRRAADKQPVPLDEPLLAALESGLPACAGVAVGLDRLLMIATGADDIRDVVTFAFDNPAD
jgi:lysyl-tRNA synthetase class 2